MCFCKKCTKLMGVMALVLGGLFLLRDLNVWSFWNISWWTVMFLVAGMAYIGASCCPDCQAMCGTKKK